MNCTVLEEVELRIGENLRRTFGFSDDTVLTDWTCRINLRLEEDPSATPLVNRVVTDTNTGDTRFIINLTPTETSTLAPGKTYILGLELTNVTTEDSKEGRIRLKMSRGWVSVT